MRLRLDAALRLSQSPANDVAKLVGEFSRNIESYFKTSQEGEDLKSILFYICQISSNRNFSNDVTEKLMGRAIEAYENRSPHFQQHSEGRNSPNIVGNQNVVTFNPSGRLSEQEPTDRDDKKLYFECNIKPLPKTIPTGGLRAVMCGAHPPDPHSSYEIWESGNPGDVNRLVKYGLGDNGSGGAGFMCQVTYYGKNPILKVDLPFALEFREVVGGNVKFVTTRPARIRKLETNEKYDFFLFNASEYVLNISTPQYADVEPLGEYKSRRVKLSTPYSYDGSFAMQLAPVMHPSPAAK
jgi:hypothetical protein